MALLQKTSRNQYLLLLSTLVLINIVNYVEIGLFAPLQMNDFVSGFFLGALISLVPIGLYFKKLKK